MPLRPLSPAKTAQESNRLLPGAIVMYEQHSKLLLGMLTSEKNGKWQVTNEQGDELMLPPARLTLLPPPDSPLNDGLSGGAKARAAVLTSITERAEAARQELSLAEVWEVLQGEVKETTVEEIAEMALGDNTLVNHLAVRRELAEDSVYFKRKKTGFEPRTPETVEQLKKQAAVEKEKQLRRERFLQQSLQRLKDPSSPLPEDIELLVEIAVMGQTADDPKETRALLDRLTEKSGSALRGRPEERAFELLVAMEHFTPDQNLIPLRFGRPVSFTEAELEEARKLTANEAVLNEPDREDLRELFTFTIDAEETRDYDDALSAIKHEGGYRIAIHITDVASILPERSPLIDAAYRRGISVYCPEENLPMLPRELSENSLSLVQGQDRTAMTFWLDVDESFSILDRRITFSVINVDRRLTYIEADDLLFSEDSSSSELREALTACWELTCASDIRRLQRGALQLNRRELYPVVHSDNSITLEEGNDEKPARKLVSEMMILANETAALYGKTNALPLIYRTQEPPDQDPIEHTKDIPDGPAREYYKRSVLKRSIISYEAGLHAGLGVDAYVQLTSPIRRASDLINQRQLGAHIRQNQPRYTPQEITELLAEFEGGLEEASKIQRARTRYWLLKYLIQENIRELDAVIIKLEGPRPLAELDIIYMFHPFHPAQRKGSERKIGDRVRLRIDSIDPRNDTLVLREI